MKRLFLLTAFMFLFVCCETDQPRNVQLATFGLQNNGNASIPIDSPETDSTAKIKIAIFHFENRTGDPGLSWLENGISDMFGTQLHKTNDINILDMDELSREASDLRYESNDLFDMSAAVQTARNAKADLIISGNFYQKNDSLFIDVLLNNVHTGDNLWKETVKGHGMEQLLAMLDIISSHIQENIPVNLQKINKK